MEARQHPILPREAAGDTAAQPPAGITAGITDEITAEITAMLQQVTGEDGTWAGRITTASRLDSDLLLESIEVAGLADLLRERYGDGVDLPGLLAGLDPDGLIALSVGDLVRHVAGHGAADRPAVRR